MVRNVFVFVLAVVINTKISTGDNMSLPKPTISVGEELVEVNPFRNKQTELQYRRIAKIAVDHFRRSSGEKDIPDITFHFSYKAEDEFKKIPQSSLIFTGFLYSDVAVKAANFSLNEKIPYLSPVSPMKAVFTSTYSKGLAPDSENLKRAAKLLSKHLLPGKSYLFFPMTKLVNKVHAEAYRSAIKFDKEFSYLSSTPPTDTSFVGKEKVINIVMAGSGYEHADYVKYLIDSYPNTRFRFFGNHRWVYSQEAFIKSLGNTDADILIMSEFTDYSYACARKHIPEKIIQNFCLVQKDYQASYKVRPEELLVYSIYDAITLSLHAVKNAKSPSRQAVLEVFDKLKFVGAAGSYNFINGKTNRLLYLMRWQAKHFEPIASV